MTIVKLPNRIPYVSLVYPLSGGFFKIVHTGQEMPDVGNYATIDLVMYLPCVHDADHLATLSLDLLFGESIYFFDEELSLGWGYQDSSSDYFLDDFLYRIDTLTGESVRKLYEEADATAVSDFAGLESLLEARITAHNLSLED